jgi:hypothetical protein
MGCQLRGGIVGRAASTDRFETRIEEIVNDFPILRRTTKRSSVITRAA